MKRFFSITFFYYLCTNNHKVTKKMKQQETTPKTREQYIRQAILRYGWTEPVDFNAYVEDYL